MNRIMTAVLLSASLIMGGCSAIGDTRIEQVQTIAEVTFLAKNVDAMTEKLLSIEFTSSERAEVEKGLAMFDKIKVQVARIAKGDIDVQLVLDFPTANQIHIDIGKAYNQIVLKGLKPYSMRTGHHPGDEFLQFNRIGRSVWQRVGAMLETKEVIGLDAFIGQLKLFATTFSIVQMHVRGAPVGPTI